MHSENRPKHDENTYSSGEPSISTESTNPGVEIHSSDLLNQFEYLLQHSDHVEIAVAWLSWGKAFQKLLEYIDNGGSVRAIVGTSGCATHPDALRRLYENCDLRIATSSNVTLFHPKAYIFRSEDTLTGWVGSNNLTESGFSKNTELAAIFQQGAHELLEWFEYKWHMLLDQDTSSAIDQYAADWSSRTSKLGTQISRHNTTPSLHGKISWTQYVDAILQADAYWPYNLDDESSVLGDVQSWESTIGFGNSVTRLPNWNKLHALEADALIGSGQRGPSLALLGNNTGSGYSNHMLRDPEFAARREEIRQALLPLAHVSAEQFPAEAERVMSALQEMPRLGPGVASRLIALTRPDFGISVNGASRDNLAAASGLSPTTLGTPKNYRRLLEWVSIQPWHQKTCPEDPIERRIWEFRGALIDTLAYDIEFHNR